ncbi:plasmid pRiA4b ORF-3 family protein [Solwaraspora sp. WMMD406]|uniref:plasmid pRiA4b ORF-3 family protein n=1 Tax=Solwaraspora sp. WMMD406 TaxID=3016095 RepID=UPI002417F5FE|nr:plasmid pRiA4b ORF-3 family protein [Solwaraspora sp. WMMD406]MDG4766467.1 plasmid pRiA4b ORF-3 family protein [Solwaraspora sp. WMMD406]
MSPVSRGRKKVKSRTGARGRTPVSLVPEQCDCPECSDPAFEPGGFVAKLLAAAADLPDENDPLAAELFGAGFVAVGESAADGFGQALAEGIVPALAQRSSRESVAVLLAIDSVRADAGAADAARTLLAAGVPAPAWSGDLSETLKVGLCRRYGDSTGAASMLLCSFERTGRPHGFLVQVDHLDCDAAGEISLLPGELLDDVDAMIRTDLRRADVSFTVDDLDPGEFRWQVQRALDARATHDRQDGEPGSDGDFGDEDGPGYHPLAVLLRARLAALPEPTRPPAEHGHGDGDPAAMLEMLAEIVGQAQRIKAGGRLRRVPSRAPKLPRKRKKSDGPAPIYQVKVSLRGAKPPIWRRLELPGDTTLADVHDILQVAFDWDDSHLHVFDTPYGMFGVPDPDLDHRSAAAVTLEQVAPGVGAKLRYRYDFGDSWDHEIVVEKSLDRQAVVYPRCTGGRRAAPPEDCGGIWGYGYLVEVLADPSHPEHDERREWLGMGPDDDFDPARFDTAEVTRQLTGQGG